MKQTTQKMGVRKRTYKRSKALPAGAQVRFDTFLHCANISSLHPLDWQRFYIFTQYCHTRRVKLSEEQMFQLLLESYFREQYARHIADIYGHIRDFLKLRN